MREILFRGQRTGNGKWVYGYLCFVYIDKPEKSRIYDPQAVNSYDVLTESVGQFTGLTDKNGTNIFEGNIGWDCHNECYGIVEFSDGGFSYVWENIRTDLFEVSNDVDIDFIGNIHDNPELLGGGAE